MSLPHPSQYNRHNIEPEYEEEEYLTDEDIAIQEWSNVATEGFQRLSRRHPGEVSDLKKVAIVKHMPESDDPDLDIEETYEELFGPGQRYDQSTPAGRSAWFDDQFAEADEELNREDGDPNGET